jgi:hypothetical protein
MNAHELNWLIGLIDDALAMDDLLPVPEWN